MTNDVDWVKALSECTSEAAIMRLWAGVESDVASRNALRQDGDRYKFTVSETAGGFAVVYDSGQERDTLRFTVKDLEYVTIQSGGQDDGYAVVTRLVVDDSGAVVFALGDRRLPDWQLRRHVLRNFLFRDRR